MKQPEGLAGGQGRFAVGRFSKFWSNAETGVVATLAALMGIGTGIMIGFVLAQPLRFFPKPRDFGNWAEWINALVALVVGIAIFGLGKKTNALGEAAHRLGLRSHRIEAEAHLSAQRQQAHERQLLLIYLYPEFAALDTKLDVIKRRTDYEDFVDLYTGQEDQRTSFCRSIDQLDITLAAAKFDRLSVVGEPLGGTIASVIGGIEMIRLVARQGVHCKTSSQCEAVAKELQNAVKRLSEDVVELVAASVNARKQLTMARQVPPSAHDLWPESRGVYPGNDTRGFELIDDAACCSFDLA